jgi:putative heme iron utilization protein
MQPNTANATEAALVRAQELVQRIRDSATMVHLATASADGTPESSLVPAVLESDGEIIVLVSGLARHTANLRENPRASILLLEKDGETARRQPMATPRLTLRCQVEPLPRDGPTWGQAMSRFHAVFGEAVAVLSALSDFGTFRLRPEAGRLVAGFGQAFEVDPRDWTRLTRVGPPPHPREKETES